jgi:hypothetical protein
MGSPLAGTGAGKELRHLVKLHITSCDGQWSARVIKALVVPCLHIDLNLGMNFLALNRIVVDAEMHSVLCKDNGYDLLHPSPVTPTPPVESPKPPCQRQEEQAHEAIATLIESKAEHFHYGNQYLQSFVAQQAGSPLFLYKSFHLHSWCSILPSYQRSRRFKSDMLRLMQS